MTNPIEILESAIDAALSAASAGAAGDAEAEAVTLRDLSLRAKKLKRAWGRPQCLGLFGPSQAGKSFLVGALLAHEMGSLKVLAKGRELDFLKEINPAKGVESTGVVTRFSSGPGPVLARGDFYCRVLSLDVVLESLATGFLVECTSPPVDIDRIERALSGAKLQVGPAAPPIFQTAWEAVWHDLLKKYQDRHAYLNELKRHAQLSQGAWKKDVKTVAGWLQVYSLLWGGPGYAPDMDDLARRLVAGLDALGYPEAIEAELSHVRASSDKPSIMDASCLNALGVAKDVVRVFTAESGREVAVDPGVLSALIAEVRLPLARIAGSLLDRCDILDFPGGRALKGINGFGRAELSTGKLENAIEVYKRGKLTFLFEQYALDREITALVLCSPGPTKPEAIQLQSQVESWLQIRHGAATPAAPDELETPSLFLALTKFDMSLGALRSDNAKDRWDSRVQEACIDFWSRSGSSWTSNWGAKGKPFTNLFWIRNPYADQMQTLKPGEPDFESVKQGYFQSRAVARHIAFPADKWAAVEGLDQSGLPRSGVPLLAAAMKEKLAEDIKAKELAEEARTIKRELAVVLKALTPSKDEAEARARMLENAKALVDAIDVEMGRRCSGTVFGDLLGLLVVPIEDVEDEVERVWMQVSPMSIKTSDKVKKILVHMLKWWEKRASERLRTSNLPLPAASVESFVRELVTSKLLLPVLGNSIFPYFSRKEVDAKLVATVLQVKITDGMLSLFVDTDRKPSPNPVRLSYAETQPTNTGAGAERSSEVDWTNVSFEEEATPSEAKKVEIVFAGNRYYRHWSAHLGDFYLRSGGHKAALAAEDPRVLRLVETLKLVESIDV